MKALILALSLISTLAMAETAKISIDGMHCSGCKDLITSKVCKDDKIAKNAESCEVKLLDAKKQKGEVVIVTKKDAHVDMDAVKADVAAAGDDYKISKVDIRDVVKKDLATQGKLDPVNSATVTTTETVEKTTTDQSGKVTKEIKKTKKIVRKKAEKPDATTTTTTTNDTKTETK
ncbi:MAG: hypothetical protein ACXWQQ_13665 [Pseudobdellovibrio sp.]